MGVQLEFSSGASRGAPHGVATLKPLRIKDLELWEKRSQVVALSGPAEELYELFRAAGTFFGIFRGHSGSGHVGSLWQAGALSSLSLLLDGWLPLSYPPSPAT